MLITIDILSDIFPKRDRSFLDQFVIPMNEIFTHYQINTKRRISYFLANAAHETMGFTHFREIASGKDYDTGKKAESLGNTPEADGDGQKYKGRGIFQTTGKRNYTRVSKAFNHDFINHPEDLEQPYWAVWSAGLYWSDNKLNKFADLGYFETVVRRINGGYNGLAERKKWLARIEQIFENYES